MSDGYQKFVSKGLGKKLATTLGLPRPVRLRRGRTQPEGSVAFGVVGEGSPAIGGALSALGLEPMEALRDSAVDALATEADAPSCPAYSEKIGAVIVDATTVTSIGDLEQVRAILRPALKGMGRCGRVVVVGPVPPATVDVEAAAAAQALEGIVRSVGKEMRAGGTANLVSVTPEAAAETDGHSLVSTLSFLMEGRSAYVSGQPFCVGTGGEARPVTSKPLAGKVVVVTGAARGIGVGIAKVLAGQGASAVALDIPAAGDALARVANEIGGVALQLDITAPDAGERIAALVAKRFGGDQPGELYGIVHNAGITRDKLLANTDAERWASVLQVNLAASLRINEVLLSGVDGGLVDGSRIVGVASTSGIGGNRGQANYAASKAGVIGQVRSMAPQVAERGMTVNAVAPGFIETEMTAKMPVGTREVGRRINSVQQGGQPVDVAEAVGYFLDPASGGVNGQVLRVCGQSQLGA